MTDLKELAKRRGFYIPSNEIYGGTAGFYSFGPRGAEMKSKLENSWREKFKQKEGNMEIDAPTVMPEPVFKASGHLETFDDMIMECPGCGESIRADHLVEDNTGIEEAESFSTGKIEEVIEDESLKCGSCGEDLSDVKVDDFNLMFSTSIGPGDSSPGYLRPETAQGIFVEFPQWKEYARNKLPFGVTQIGKAYRNEISPRKSIVRVREFTQAELEMFIDPERNSPDLEKLEDVELRLYPVEEQEDDSGGIVEATVREAVDEGLVDEWVAYYLGLAKEWYTDVGVDPGRLRFRQHLPDERSHYASDCWDAESEIGAGDWIEIAGFAYRGSYDLKKHQEHSGEDFTVFREFDEPRTVEEVNVKPDMGFFGPEYGEDASDVVEAVEEVAAKDPGRFDSGTVELTVEGKKYSIPSGEVEVSIEEQRKTGERVMPETVEPSFGIGRTIYTVLVHSLDEDEVDGEERTVLHLPSEVSPVEVAVLPLMEKDGLDRKAKKIEEQLREQGFRTFYDESGSIGRRYRRQDEIGTPVCVTVDHQTLEDGTVTVRNRDSTEQERVEIDELENAVKES